jgi:L-lysine 6-transaminase
MAEEFPGVVSNVRGRGLFVALDLPDKAMRDRVLAACLEHGLIGLASGACAIRFRPALTLSREEAEEGVRKLRRALADARG